MKNIFIGARQPYRNCCVHTRCTAMLIHFLFQAFAQICKKKSHLKMIVKNCIKKKTKQNCQIGTCFISDRRPIHGRPLIQVIGLCECSHAFFLSMFLLMLPFPHDAQGEMSAKIVFRSMLLREPLQEPFKNCVKCGNWKVISRSEFKLQPSKLQVGQLFLSLRKMTAQGNCRTSFVGGLLMVYSCELYWLV